MQRKAHIPANPDPRNWRALWPLGVERAAPYVLIRGADLTDRATVDAWLDENIGQGSERACFERARLEFLAAKRQQTSA